MATAKAAFNHFFEGESWSFLPGDTVPEDIAETIGNKAGCLEQEEEETFLPDYRSLSVAKLRRLVRERGLDPQGNTMDELILALETADAAAS